MSALPILPLDGSDYDPALDGARLRDQILRVYSAMEDGGWRTLSEIAAITKDPEASISAQLRHLRKPKFGSYIVERRRRGLMTAGLWEYRLMPPTTAVPAAPSAIKNTGFLKGLMWAARIVAKASSLAEAKAQLRVELMKAAYRKAT